MRHRDIVQRDIKRGSQDNTEGQTVLLYRTDDGDHASYCGIVGTSGTEAGAAYSADRGLIQRG